MSVPELCQGLPKHRFSRLNNADGSVSHALDSALMMLNACKTYGIVQNNQYQHQVDMLFMDLSRVTNLMPRRAIG